MNNSRSRGMFKVFNILIAALILLQLPAGCIFYERKGGIRNTYLRDMKVDPPVGSPQFQITVDYTYGKNGQGKPANIRCSYFRPDGEELYIDTIEPALDVEGQTLVEGDNIRNQTVLPFSVVQSDGAIIEGPYKARCVTELDFFVDVPFSVKKEEVKAKPAAPVEVAPVQTEVTEPVVTEAPLPVVNLKVEMLATDVDPPIRATWEGSFPINPEGSVRKTLPGVITSSTAYSIAGQHAGTYQVHITFNVDLAGSAELTPEGVKLNVQQTVADSHLDPITVSEGSLDADAMARITKGIQEAYPNWLNKIVKGLEFEGASLPLTQEVAVGAWKGTATLSKGQ